jgi:hypothetical protein
MRKRTAARRALDFDTLDRVMPDVDRLMERGYTSVGKWTLGQVCNHLSKSLAASVDGYPMKKAPWLLRKTFAPIFLNKMLKTGVMPEGLKGPEFLMPKPDLDDRAEVEALRATLGLFARHNGPMAEHPFFGTLTRDREERFHCIHCAHHLSFLLPNDPA